MQTYSEARQFAEENGIGWWSWKNIGSILLGAAISLPLTTAIPIISFIVIVLVGEVGEGEAWSIALTVGILIMVIVEKVAVLIGLGVLCIRECMGSGE